MLYAVIEDKLGLNVQAEYDQIGIRRAEAQRMEREQRDAQEVVDAAKDKGKGITVEEVLESSSQKDQETINAGDNPDMSIDLSQQFTLVGSPVDVPYSIEDIKRRKELERRKSKSKMMVKKMTKKVMMKRIKS
ncbi:hypothetical protein Hanom_Chr17g01590891 [Helianthus anomalus]